jgi:hypothetical protein
MMPETPPNNLKGIVAEIAQVIGDKDANSLALRLSGQRIYCCEGSVSDEHPVVFAIGKEQTEKLFAYFAGDTLELPTNHSYRVSRDAHIRKLYRQDGMDANEIASRFSLSRRQIFYIVGAGKKQRPAPKPEPATEKQGDLF